MSWHLLFADVREGAEDAKLMPSCIVVHCIFRGHHLGIPLSLAKVGWRGCLGPLGCWCAGRSCRVETVLVVVTRGGIYFCTTTILLSDKCIPSLCILTNINSTT